VIILGLTGSIGMGKSTAAAAMRALGLPVFDADCVVHGLLAPGGAAVARVAMAFEGVRDAAGGIDRARLGRSVFADPAALSRLEAIVHPLVEAAEKRFLARARSHREALAVLDIPLLFETGAERRCDFVLVVTAPVWLQRQRVMRRPGMSQDRFQAVIRQQMPDREKRRRADFVVSTGLSRNHALRQLRGIMGSLINRTAPAGWRRGRGHHRARG
jgi:dephospho-CoA kinase